VICPKCKAEYREGFSVCSDCDVPLVNLLPATGSSSHESSDDEEAEFLPETSDNRFCLFWQGNDARLHGEICDILDEEGIPHRSFRHEQHLFRFTADSTFKIGIPEDRFDQAEKAIQEAYAPEDRLTEALRKPPALPE
jgi:hypothetical protein